MTKAELTSDPSPDVVSALVRAPVDAMERVGGGRNSRVFRVRAGGHNFALKQYPSREDDPRDRLGTEVAALRLMEQFHVKSVPRVEGVDVRRNFTLLSWIEGQAVREVCDTDIDQACAFLAEVHALRGAGVIPEHSHAAEACLSGAEIERQLTERLAQLRALPTREMELFVFLDREFEEAHRRFQLHARATMAASSLDFERPLPQEGRSLVPSDFGFHNSLRQLDGSLAFLDFEYFGWDDPVKLTADILLHPGTPLPGALQARLRAAAERLYGDDPSFRTRLAAFMPLFALRWVLILLNEFHPERWRRRQLAGAMEDWDEAKSRQLARARALLEKIETNEPGRSYAERG